jgi:hypothetical protein
MSSTILMVIVLVVMWLVVLVPMFVRRHDDSGEVRSKERVATAVRVLSRRSQRSAGTQPASASRPAVGRTREPAPGPRPRSAAVGQVRAEAQRRMLARRRRTVAMLATLVVVGAGGAFAITDWLWSLSGVGAALFTSYLVWLRQQVRRQQQRWQRRAAVFSRTTPSHPPHVVRPARPRRVVRRDPASSAEPGSRSEPADHATPAPPAADGSWQPTPVPVPTYVTKPAARQTTDPRGRAESVIALDDDDPSFAEIEDVVPPVERRRAVNG